MALGRDLKRILTLLAPEGTRYAIGLFALFLVNFCDVLAPLFLTVAIDRLGEVTGLPPAPPPPLIAAFGVQVAGWSVVAATAGYFALQIGANVFRYPMLMFVALPSHQIGQNLRNALVDQFFKLSAPYYDKAKSGDLMSLATADIMAARMMFGPGILVGSDALMIVSLVVIVMLSLSWKLTLIAMTPLPVIAALTNWLSHAEYSRFEAVQADLAKLTERTRESFAGLRVLQAYAREPFDIGRFAVASERHRGLQVSLARVKSVFGPTLDLMTGVSTALVVIFGGRDVVSGSISLGTFVAFLFLIGFLSGPMMGFGWSVSLIQRGRASLARLDAFLREAPSAEFSEGAAELGTAAPEVRVEGLTFAYPGSTAPVLRDISFTLSPGKTLGVIGPVGSGKSSLARVLVRLYEPPRGTVFVDGIDVLELSVAALRKAIVLAPQDTFLFSDTVERNIALADQLGHPVADYARRAHLHDEVVALRDGYASLLGERGLTLSGGQRQRLAIARTLAAEPRVMVLDDCLSAVDAKTERAILGSLRDAFAGRSGVIISHRVCAVQDCDEIIVLENGAVAERGTHSELLTRGGFYAAVAREQGAPGEMRS